MNRHEFMSDTKMRIRRLFELNKLFEALNESVNAHVMSLAAELKKVDMDAASIDKVTDLVYKSFTKDIENETLLNMLIRAHEKNLTTDEVNELLSFFEDPRTERIFSKMRELNKITGDICREWQEQKTLEFKPEFDVIINEAKEKKLKEIKGNMAKQGVQQMMKGILDKDTLDASENEWKKAIDRLSNDTYNEGR